MQNGEQSVAVRLKTLRDRRGWSQNQLSTHSDVSNSTISRIESGDIQSPGVDVLRKLSGALGVELAEITGERPMPRRQVQVFEGGAAVPVMQRRVHAGGDSYWGDTNDTVHISLYLKARHPNVKAAKVTGDCMEPWVMEGESVVFDPDQRPVDRDMVIVTDDEGHTMVKWYRTDENGAAYLVAADGVPIVPDGARIEGVVIAAYRTDLRQPGP